MPFRSFARAARLVPLVLVLPLAACGGGGGGGGPDTTEPYVDVQFPPGPALTTGATVQVRGQADDDRGVTGVTVAGVAATSSDGFETWVATVPVTAFAGTVTAVATDAAGNTASWTVDPVTRVAPFVHRPRFLAFSSAAGAVLASDLSLDAVLQVTTGGTTSVVSSPSVGTGPRVLIPGPLATEGGAAFVIDARDNTILRVDRATGARTVVSSTSVGSGPSPVTVSGLAFDPVRGRLVMIDLFQTSPSQRSRLLAIDPASGARSVVSVAGGTPVGSGPDLTSAISLAYDATGDRFLVGNGNTVIGVAPVSGDRTLLTGGGVGGGAALASVRGLVADGAGGAYLLHANASLGVPLDGALAHVDLATGIRTAVDFGAVSAPTLQQVGDLVRDPASGELFIGDGYAGRIRGVTLGAAATASAVRVLAGDEARIGSGDEFVFPEGIAVSDGGSAVYVTDSRNRTVTAVSTWSNQRFVISGAGAGSGPALGVPRAIAIDQANNRLLVSDSNVVAVTIPAGVRSVLHTDDGTLFNAQKMALDALRGRVVISTGSGGELHAVALATGARSMVTTDAAASPNMAGIGPIAHLADLDRLLVVDLALDLFRLHPTNGTRERIRDSGLATANIFDASAVVSDGIDAWIVDGQRSQVLRVRLSSGATVTVYDTVGAGVQGSSNVGDAAFDEVTDTLYWIDAGMKAVTAVDVITGERVIVSR